MTDAHNAGEERKIPKHLIPLGFAIGWGPVVVIALVVYFATRRVPYALLTFAIASAITAVVLGALGSVHMKRRQRR